MAEATHTRLHPYKLRYQAELVMATGHTHVYATDAEKKHEQSQQQELDLYPVPNNVDM